VSAFLLLLVKLNLAIGAAIALVSLLRRPLRARFGAPIAYAVWFLVPIAGIASLFPPRVAAPVPLAHIAPVHVPIAPVHVPVAPVLAPVASAHVLVAPVSVTGYIAHSALRVTEQLTGQSALVLSAPPQAPAYAMPDTALPLFAAWALGALLMVLYLTRLQLRFHAAVRLGEAGPAVLGFLRPRIVTPDGFQERFTPQEQAAILAHERVHLARQDARTNALTALLRCLCWFNPLIHLGARWLRIDQEFACDATAVTGAISRRTYAKALLKSQMVVTALPLGCNWPGSQHPLIERIALLKRKPPGTVRRFVGASLVVLAATSAGLGAWAAQPPVAAKAMAAPQPGTVLASLPAMVAAPGQTVGGPNPPVANANPAGSGNDVDVSKNDPANIAVSTPPGPANAEMPTTGSIEARTKSTIAALPQIAPVAESSNKTIVGQTSEDASSEPKDTVAQTADAAHPGTEAALRHQIESMEKDQPDYSVMVPSLARASREQYESGQIDFKKKWGALKSITFRENQNGNDVYLVEFENQLSTWTIGPLQPDGKIGPTLFFGPAIKRDGNGPSPGLEAAIRLELDGDTSGNPTLEIMSQGLQNATQNQWKKISAIAKDLGAVQTITFQKVNARGWDVYHVTFASGTATVQAAPLTDGKLIGILHTDIMMPHALQHPGTEAWLRRYIMAIQNGTPNYEDMGLFLTNAVRQQWPDQQPLYKSLGALQSLTFEGGGGNGIDVYLATFRNGKIRWHIEAPDATGKLNTLFFQKVT